MKKTLTLLWACWLSATAAIAQSQAPMRLWFNRPADFFEESLLIGNGKLGASVYGGTDDNIIFLNDITLWTGKPVDPNLDAGASIWIPRIREALFNEDYALADSLQLRVQGPNSQFFQPLGTLHILDDDSSATVGYYRELSLDSALCHDRYERGGKQFRREYFASNPDKLIAIRIESDGPHINCRLVLTAQVPHKCKAAALASGVGQLTMTGHAIGDEKESIRFCSMLKAQTDQGEVSSSDSTLTIRGAKTLTLYFVNETSFNGADHHPVSEGAPYLDEVANDLWHTANYTYEEMRQHHIDDYRQFFTRTTLSLSQPGQALHRQRTRQPLSGDPLFPIWPLSAHLLLTHPVGACQSARTMDTPPVLALAGQLHREHQPRGELLARRSGQPQRDDHSAMGIHAVAGQQRTARGPQLLWY